MKELVVVTGGTKGIGRAIIEKFASQGYQIATCARDKGALEALYQELKDKYKIHLQWKVSDVSEQSQAKKFATMVNDLGVPVAALVNNAGTYVPGKIYNEEEGMLEKMINTNVYSAYHITRKLIDGMITQKKGHIFNICSTASIMPYVDGGSYCISKYAMLGMTKVLREEVKEHNVKVTAIMPGATLTASWEGVDLPEDRFMPAKDVAEAVYGAFSMSNSTVIEEILMRPQLGDI